MDCRFTSIASATALRRVRTDSVYFRHRFSPPRPGVFGSLPTAAIGAHGWRGRCAVADCRALTAWILFAVYPVVVPIKVRGVPRLSSVQRRCTNLTGRTQLRYAALVSPKTVSSSVATSGEEVKVVNPQ